MSNLKKFQILTFIRFFAESLFFPFISLYMSSKGYITSEIGMIISMIPITSMICAPIYSKICKNTKQSKIALTIMSMVEAVFIILLLLFSNNFIFSIIIVILISAVSSSNYGLIDSLMALTCRVNNKPFSTIRIFGSISYMIGVVGAGYVIAYTSYELLFSCAAALYIIVSIIYMFLKAPVDDSETLEKSSIKNVLSNKLFIGYLFFYILLIGSMQVGDDFFAIFLESKGQESYVYSLLMGGFILVEIATLLILGKFSKKPSIKLYFIASSVLVIKLFLQAIPNAPVSLLIISQLSRGIIWGITLFVSSFYVIQTLGFNKSTTGIVLVTFGVSIFASIFKFSGGFIIENIGYSNFYLIIAFIALLSFIYLCVYYSYYKKIEKKKTSNINLEQ